MKSFGCLVVLSQLLEKKKHFASKLMEYGQKLMESFGRDPILLETLADYSLDASTSCELYEEAIDSLDGGGLDSSSPRLSLAELILRGHVVNYSVADIIAPIDYRLLDPVDRVRLDEIREKSNADNS